MPLPRQGRAVDRSRGRSPITRKAGFGPDSLEYPPLTFWYFKWSDPDVPPSGGSAAAPGVWQLRKDAKEGSGSAAPTQYLSFQQKPSEILSHAQN